MSRDSNVLMRTSSNVDDEEALLTQRINELITEKYELRMCLIWMIYTLLFRSV